MVNCCEFTQKGNNAQFVIHNTIYLKSNYKVLVLNDRLCIILFFHGK